MTVVVRDGKITAVGANVQAPAGARIIDAGGRVVTPGLVVANTTLSVAEVNAIEQTNDFESASPNVTAAFDVQKEELRIRMGDPSDPVTSLSGGNQQKVVLAKWLSAHPRLLILDNPTQGVDVGAKEDIYDIILRLAEQGVAVIVLSNEAQEIIRVCDRALVMYHGDVQAEVSGKRMNEQEMMRLATGG